MFVDLNTIGLAWPEIILILIAAWIYIGGTVTQGRHLWTLLAVITYLFVGWVLVRNESNLWASLAEGKTGWSGPLTIDYLGQTSRLVSLVVGLLLTLLVARPAPRQLATEVIGCLMVLVAGIMLVSRANDLVFLFVSLELISIPTYVLLFLGRRNRATSEATAKYFFLSILSSAILLYGMTFLYGVGGGTTVISEIRAALTELTPAKTGLFLVGLVMVVSGLAFKITAVPFHFYAPDVYQGATNANAGLLAVAPKIAGLLALVRLVTGLVPAGMELGWQLILVLSLVTMTLGNACALWQQNVRRLMAYSSIAHAGYLLIGLAVAMAVPEYAGIAAAMFYVVAYAFAALGTFAALTYLSDQQHEVSEVRELAGLRRSHPWIAAAIAICMFSLAGIPPLAGFWGKLALFAGAVQIATAAGTGSQANWFLILAIVGALNAAVGAAYYLRVVRTMYFQAPVAPRKLTGGYYALTAMVACVICVIGIGVMPGIVFQGARRSDPLAGEIREQVELPKRTAAQQPVQVNPFYDVQYEMSDINLVSRNAAQQDDIGASQQ